MDIDPVYELIKNDFFIYFIIRNLKLSPLLIFFISLVLQVILPFIFTFFQKTLTTSQVIQSIKNIYPRYSENISDHKNILIGGAGFLSRENVYLIFLPFLNYSIFKYYESAGQNIWQFIEIHSINKIETQLIFHDSFNLFNSDFAQVIIYLALIIGLTAFIWFPIKNTKMAILRGYDGNKIELPRYDWIFNNGKPRPLAFIFSFTTHFLQLAIILGWVIRHILLCTTVIPRTLNKIDFQVTSLMFYPDKMFGFYPWESIATDVGFIAASVGFVLFSWNIGCMKRKGSWYASFKEIGPLSVS